MTVAPGAIATEMIDRFAGGEGSENRQWLASQHPMGRLGQAKEIAAAVLYLASDAASFTTGSRCQWTEDIWRNNRWTSLLFKIAVLDIEIRGAIMIQVRKGSCR